LHGHGKNGGRSGAETITIRQLGAVLEGLIFRAVNCDEGFSARNSHAEEALQEATKNHQKYLRISAQGPSPAVSSFR
jgi:hypothetical protein